jgi:hypothetical protein
MKVVLKERGWGGHFCCANRCGFRRNTLATLLDDDGVVQAEVVVSTVGLLQLSHDSEIEEVGLGRYFETMAFWARASDVRYHDADVSREIRFNSPWSINVVDADDRANAMHDVVVEEIAGSLMAGSLQEYV